MAKELTLIDEKPENSYNNCSQIRPPFPMHKLYGILIESLILRRICGQRRASKAKINLMNTSSLLATEVFENDYCNMTKLQKSSSYIWRTGIPGSRTSF